MRCTDFAMRCNAVSGIIPVAAPALLPITSAEATLVACAPIGIQVPNCVVTRCIVVGAEPCGASDAAKILSAGAHVVLGFNPSNSTKERKAEASALLPFDTGGYSSCSQKSLQLLRELKQQQASVRNTQPRLPVSKLAENHQIQK